ncbi:CDP-glycerol glycerophosphotransferase family protein, partial [Clostridioides difficile]
DDIKENITGKRIVFLDKGVTLANEIRKSAANITDYSSVAIDFLYMNRPILFYQFDLDEYMEKVDSYIDLKSEMFGSLAYNNDEAVNKLIDIIENNFEVMDNQKNERNKFFRYNDNKNCKRIYDCVLSKIK